MKSELHITAKTRRPGVTTNTPPLKMEQSEKSFTFGDP